MAHVSSATVDVVVYLTDPVPTRVKSGGHWHDQPSGPDQNWNHFQWFRSNEYLQVE